MPLAARPAGLPREDLIEAAAALRPVLEKNAAQVEKDRTLTTAVVDALEAAGLWKVQTPKRFGGHEAPLAAKLECTAALSEGCPSTGWVFFILNICHWLASLYSDKAQREVWGDNPAARVCGVLPPWSKTKAVAGGLEVTGKWAFASGCAHADWAALGVPVVDRDGKPIDEGLALIPRKEWSIEDTWHVAGMRGTGSNSIVVNQVFVPQHRILSMSRAIQGDYASEHKDEVCYRTSLFPQLAIELVGAQLGIGRAALQYVIDKAAVRGVTYTKYEKQTQSVAHHLGIAEAAMLVDGASLHSHRAVNDIWSAAERGEKMDYLARARVRADTGWAIRQTLTALDKLLTLHGTSALAEFNPLQRWWRDANIAGRHAVADPQLNLEVYGGAVLGADPITPLV
jgi:alkylation response protein AidB-like acyl-CoA dehydrogenase